MDEVQKYWIEVISTIEAAEDEQTVINFIRNYWSSKKGLVREKDLFDQIKRNVTSKAETIALSRGLCDSSIFCSQTSGQTEVKIDQMFANFSPT